MLCFSSSSVYGSQFGCKICRCYHSVVLQDDFLPLTTTALEDVFKSLLCLPCLLCLMCLKDTCTLEEKLLRDPRRLYAPGRIYHVVERKPFRVGRFPPVVRTAVPVDGRFEHIVLSCNATSDHAVIWIEREAQRALDSCPSNCTEIIIFHHQLMKKDPLMEVPAKQRMERNESLAPHNQEYKAALQRAVALDIPQAYSPTLYGTFHESDAREDSASSSGKVSSLSCKKRNDSWNDFVELLFDVDDSGQMVFKKTHR